MHPPAFIPVTPSPPSLSRPFHSSTLPSRPSKPKLGSPPISPTSSSLPNSPTPSPSSPAPTPPTNPIAATAATAATTAVAAAAALILSTTPLPSLQPLPALAARGGGDTFLSASGDVIKDPESLLRWSLPISNKPIRELQAELEGSVNDLRGLKWPKVDAHVKSAQRVLNSASGKILASVPEYKAEMAADMLRRVGDGIPDLQAAVLEKSAEKVTKVARQLLAEVGGVESLMVEGFPYEVPEEYSGLPQLKGRATVEMVVRKGGDDVFDIDGRLLKEGRMTLVLDGYSAPVSAGAFADLVGKGFYDGKKVIRSDGFIVQAGKPDKGEGFVDEKGQLRTIPLEVFARGDKEPTYGLTLEEDGRGTVGTVLPFTAYGTLAMARNEFEPNTASSQFFWFLFEPDLTPAGRNLMDGSWAVFGYTTKGESFLKGLQKGDEIVSAKIIDGVQNLVR